MFVYFLSFSIQCSIVFVVRVVDFYRFCKLTSIAGGVTFEQLVKSVGPEQTIFRLIPNTAISQLESMTLISSRNASKEQEQLMLDIFNELGLAMLIPESQMAATTALTTWSIVTGKQTEYEIGSAHV